MCRQQSFLLIKLSFWKQAPMTILHVLIYESACKIQLGKPLQMEPIKKFLWCKSHVKSKSKDRPHISLPVEGSFQKGASNNLFTKWPSRITPGSRHSGYPRSVSPTISFTPQGRGREETLEFLKKGTSESLSSLLTERDKASEHIKLGPNTKGTHEVQQILREPTYHSVQQLHSLQRRTEMEVRYGTPGAMIYNFSKSLGWNQAAGSQLPPLQLRCFNTRMNEIQFASASIPPLPFSPINWLILPQQPAPEKSIPDGVNRDRLQYHGRSSPISEPGGWRDTEQVDIADMRPELTLEMPLGDTIASSDSSINEVVDEDSEGESYPCGIGVASTTSERQATAVKMTSVSNGQVRQVHMQNIK